MWIQLGIMETDKSNTLPAFWKKKPRKSAIREQSLLLSKISKEDSAFKADLKGEKNGT